tara:strand:- start:312 stop:617 length:306 start_codon:yes stop_codon:yes gene_type:complete
MLYGVKYETKKRPRIEYGFHYIRFESQFDARAAVESQAKEIIVQKDSVESASDIRLVDIWRLESEKLEELAPLNATGIRVVDPTIWTQNKEQWTERKEQAE